MRRHDVGSARYPFCAAERQRHVVCTKKQGQYAVRQPRRNQIPDDARIVASEQMNNVGPLAFERRKNPHTAWNKQQAYEHLEWAIQVDAKSQISSCARS